MGDKRIQWHPAFIAAINFELAENRNDLLETVSNLESKLDKELADSVLEVSTRINSRVFDELKGEDSMCNALLEFFEPEIKEMMEKGIRKSIFNAIKSFREFGHSDDEIRGVLMKNYEMSLEETELYLN